MKQKIKLVFQWVFIWTVFLSVSAFAIGSHFGANKYEIVSVKAVDNIDVNSDMDMALPMNGEKYGGGFNPYAIGYAKVGSQLFADSCINDTAVKEYYFEDNELKSAVVQCATRCRTQTDYVESKEIKLSMGECTPTGGFSPVFSGIGTS